MYKGNKLKKIFHINNMNNMNNNTTTTDTTDTNNTIHNYAHSVYDQLVNINFIRGDGPKNETQKDSFKHERLVIEYFKNSEALEFVESIESLKKDKKTTWTYNNREISVTHINNDIKTDTNHCTNESRLHDGKHIVWQIRGSQSPPDCTLLNVKDNVIKIFPIECKLCSGLIKWNDNIPSNKNIFYHVINSDTNKKCLLPGGNKHVIHPVIVDDFEEYSKAIAELNSKWSTKFRERETEKDDCGNFINPQGFSVYPRKNFTQKQRKDLNYDYTEYPEIIKKEWRQEFVERFVEFIS